MLQMTCPFCKKEFPYDNGEIDYQISRLAQEINEINGELTALKLKPYAERKAREGYRRVLAVKLMDAQKKITELKAVRKAADQQLKYAENVLLREAVRDALGDEEYLRIIKKVNEEMEAYKISGLMWHEYTRSRSKCSVTSINKL
jgi:hypothetical protein